MVGNYTTRQPGCARQTLPQCSASSSSNEPSLVLYSLSAKCYVMKLSRAAHKQDLTLFGSIHVCDILGSRRKYLTPHKLVGDWWTL